MDAVRLRRRGLSRTRRQFSSPNMVHKFRQQMPAARGLLPRWAKFLTGKVVAPADVFPGKDLSAHFAFREGLFVFTGFHEVGKMKVAIQVSDAAQNTRGVLHGGATSTLFDVASGLLFAAEGHMPGFTARLDVSFHRPAPVPSVLLITAKVDADRSHGRKVFIDASLDEFIGDEESDDGLHSDHWQTCARAKLLFVKDRPAGVPA